MSLCGVFLTTPLSAAETLKDHIKVISTARSEILKMSARLSGQDVGLALGAREILAVQESEIAHLIDLEEIDREVSEPAAKVILANKLEFRRTMMRSGCQIDVNNLNVFGSLAKSPELVLRLRTAESATRASCKILQRK